MLSALRRNCTCNCLGCLLPVLLVLALLGYGVHLLTTPPGYQPVKPAPPGELLTTVETAVSGATATGAVVAVARLTDAEATGLLRQSVGTYNGLTDLQVHILQGRVVVSGETTILRRTLVISGPVRFSGLGTGTITLSFKGLWIGQLELPSLIPEALARDFHPSFSLSSLTDGLRVPLTFYCEASRPDSLYLGVAYGAGRPVKGDSYCAEKA